MVALALPVPNTTTPPPPLSRRFLEEREPGLPAEAIARALGVSANSPFRPSLYEWLTAGIVFNR